MTGQMHDADPVPALRPVPATVAPDAGRRPVLGRRTFLRGAAVAGGALVVAAAGGVAWRMADQHVLAPGTGDAYAAWAARLAGDGTLSLVRAAILAANAHDSQPWEFRVGRSSIDVRAVRDRDLGTLDPLRREMQISVGCAIENLVVAAGANGLVPDVHLRPDAADADLMARIGLASGSTARSALFAAIPERRTDRAAYRTDRTVSPQDLEELAALTDAPETMLVWLAAAAERDRFADLTVRATEAIVGDADQARDDFRWYRQDWAAIQRHQDGITLDAAGLDEISRIAARMLPASDIGTMHRGWVDGTRERQVGTAAAFGIIVVRDPDSAAQRLQAGRLYQRVALSATTRGLAMQPLNQAVERADRERSIGLDPAFGRALTGFTGAGWHAVMPFRIGHPTRRPGLAPRRPAEAVIRGAQA